MEEKIILKFIEDGITDPDIIYNRINEPEKYVSTKSESNIINYHKEESKSSFKKNYKWCKYHKVRTHNDSECMAQKNKKPDINSINTVSEYHLPYIFIKFKSNNLIKILLDSGACQSFISSDLIDKEDWKIDSKENQIKTTATGEEQNMIGISTFVLKSNDYKINLKINLRI